ncbi:MAG: threonyl-tRNA synthetase [Bacillota bacterium]|jgi:threonyl-tRNA synthetase|nr:threonyl-tRNA synthetase [Bacillota bacterium]
MSEVVVKWNGRKELFPSGTTGEQVLRKLAPELIRQVLVMEVNGELRDLTRPLETESEIRFLTWEDEAGKRTLRHSASHVLAQAVKKLFPEAKLAIGPAIEDGFYYDFAVSRPFTPEDLEKISTEMQKIIAQDLPFERREISREEALAYFREAGEKYKLELIEDLPQDAVISLYRQGDFVDLCAGPHVPSTGYIKAFKLLNVAGAYWRGDEKREMLQRIYGTAFTTREELDEHLKLLEEAARRDHRKLGRELDLFSLQEEGPGFPFFHPKGMVLRNELEAFWRAEHRKRGYEEIRTPIILSQELWQRSGHWDHYRENMYFTEIDGRGFAIKPMNCPGCILVYKSKAHSYREFPIRLAEMGLVHRHERAGVLHGLMRVRCFTQDDAHIFMLPSQITQEIKGVIDLITHIYNVFGFSYQVELSTKPENAMGSDEIWEQATSALREALEQAGMEYKVNEGDGAFYGPKIDFHLRDCLGRTWQCGTIQLDFLMPERFDLEYTGEDGQKHRPVMIHRTVLGSMERFIGILIEHYAGAFPTWLAPVQARVLPITDRQLGYAHEVAGVLTAEGVRVEVDERNEKIGYKIRDAQLQRIPYMLIVGEKEMAQSTVAVRHRERGDRGAMPINGFIAGIKEEIAARSVEGGKWC